MKYINKLNIDFNNWNELNNKCTYIIFRSKGLSSNYNLFIGYIKQKNNKYFFVLLNDYITYGLFVINDINNNIPYNASIYYHNKKIKYKYLIKTDFYKNNKILIVGIDVNKEDILKNPELYSNNYFKEWKLYKGIKYK
jgi:hypothetical protein